MVLPLDEDLVQRSSSSTRLVSQLTQHQDRLTVHRPPTPLDTSADEAHLSQFQQHSTQLKRRLSRFAMPAEDEEALTAHLGMYPPADLPLFIPGAARRERTGTMHSPNGGSSCHASNEGMGLSTIPSPGTYQDQHAQMPLVPALHCMSPTSSQQNLAGINYTSIFSRTSVSRCMEGPVTGAVAQLCSMGPRGGGIKIMTDSIDGMASPQRQAFASRRTADTCGLADAFAGLAAGDSLDSLLGLGVQQQASSNGTFLKLKSGEMYTGGSKAGSITSSRAGSITGGLSPGSLRAKHSGPASGSTLPSMIMLDGAGGDTLSCWMTEQHLGTGGGALKRG